MLYEYKTYIERELNEYSMVMPYDAMPCNTKSG